MRHFDPRKCTMCGQMYTPTNPNQIRCPDCQKRYYSHGGTLRERRPSQYRRNRIRILDDMYIHISQKTIDELMDPDISDFAFDNRLNSIIISGGETDGSGH